MYLVRDEDGTLKMSFERPYRCFEWEDAECTKERNYWGLAHNPNITVSNQKNYPEHQIITIPKSEDDFPLITWESEPVECGIFVQPLKFKVELGETTYDGEEPKEKLSIDDFPGLKAFKEELIAKGWRKV